MRASIVPRGNKSRRHIAIALVCVVGAAAATAHARPDATGTAATTTTATSAPAPAPAPPVRSPDLPPMGRDEPRFSALTGVALWTDDFEERPRAKPSRSPHEAGRLGRYLTIGDPFVRFDPAGGIDGGGAVRMDWNAARGSARCADDSRLLEASFPATRELYIQYHVRYSPGFVFDWSRHGRCAGNAKKLFLLWAQEGSRFVFISENGTLGIGSDYDQPLHQQNRGHALRPAQLADGRWHRITLHVGQGSRSDRADGFVRGWIDGVQRWEHRGVVTHNAGGYVLFKLPATFNQGSPVAQSEWVDGLRLWRPK